MEEKGREPRAFWKILNTVLPGKTNSHATIDKVTIDGSELTEPNQIANALNNYFATVVPNLLQHEHQTKESYNNEPQEAESHFNFRKLSVDEVFKMLKTIDPKQQVLMVYQLKFLRLLLVLVQGCLHR